MTTPIDPRAEQPEAKPTVDMPKVPQWAIEMTLAMKDGFRLTNANIEVVANDLSVVKERVSILETERTKHSGGLRGLSTSNAEQDAQLAQERAARESLAAKVDKLDVMQQTQLDILGRLDKVASNPMVKTVVTILVTIIGTWAASKGISVKP